jgi:hypothetical protein
MIRLFIKGMNTLNSFIQFGVRFQIFFKLPDQANPFQFGFCQVSVFSIDIEGGKNLSLALSYKERVFPL